MSGARLLLVGLLALALAGCNKVQTVKPMAGHPGLRVGVIDALDVEAKHVNMGTASLGDFERTVRGTAWPHAKAFEDAVRAAIAPRYTPTVVQLPAPDFLRQSRLTPMYRFDDNYFVREELVPLLQAYGARQDLDVLVVLLPEDAQPDPQRPQRYQGHGLFTRCVEAVCDGRALDLFTVEVFALKPQFRQVTNGSVTRGKGNTGSTVQPIQRPETLPPGLPIEGAPSAIGAAEVNAEWPGLEALIKRRTLLTLQVAGLAD